ncbi:hypothetical protein HanXRQr2_Chr07g0280771 [Helianthus annuus]|uniref:Uncharacterized protein n=1 Tax=Helianthus annuus TaxID=4232 RepID=A0A9K3IJ25_HELAN|nr:hypothetical protein HanXRQr2_Chr07g0280771 [Helianthus annuus]
MKLIKRKFDSKHTQGVCSGRCLHIARKGFLLLNPKLTIRSKSEGKQARNLGLLLNSRSPRQGGCKFDPVKLSGSWQGMDQTGQVRKESSNGRKPGE